MEFVYLSSNFLHSEYFSYLAYGNIMNHFVILDDDDDDIE